jgi:hypothetical protein
MKDPAFLFYPNDFLSGTITMSDDQIGKYIRLLCLQHQRGHLTEKDMLFICKSYDEDIFSKFKIDDEKKYYNDRLEHEIIRRKAYSDSRSKNRKTAPAKGLSNKKDMKIISSTYDNHMETETINIINEFNLPLDYTQIIGKWLSYKKSRGEKYKTAQSLKSLIKHLSTLSANDSDVAARIVEQSIGNNWAGLFELKQSRQKQDPPKQELPYQQLKGWVS